MFFPWLYILCCSFFLCNIPFLVFVLSINLKNSFLTYCIVLLSPFLFLSTDYFSSFSLILFIIIFSCYLSLFFHKFFTFFISLASVGLILFSFFLSLSFFLSVSLSVVYHFLSSFVHVIEVFSINSDVYMYQKVHAWLTLPL